MDILNVMQNRRSIRQYADTPVSQETITAIMEAARLAPSWHNQQCWRFIVVTDKEKIAELAQSSWDFVSSAPAVIVACAVADESGAREGKHYYLVDVAIALEHANLAMTAAGLGGCWVGVFDEARVRAALDIPAPVPIVALLPFGYPKHEKGPVEKRKPLDTIVSYNTWGFGDGASTD